MSALTESRSLHARVRAMAHAYGQGLPMPEAFDAVAADLARFQARHVPGYARLCAARGVDAAALIHASQAPAVPVEAFRLARVFAFDEREATATFRTSGTTVGVRGAHALRDLGTYDAVALAFGRVMLARDLRLPVPVLVLCPSGSEAPDSSLTHMCALFVEAFGGPGSNRAYFVAEGVLDVAALRACVRSLSRGSPAIVLATSFALVHLLDALKTETLPLPPGSRIMQTGGFKGRTREVSAGDLRAATARTFAVDERAVVAEYGMTELSSQFWEATLVDPRARPGVYVEPPWARVVPVNPVTLAPVAGGEVGVARIEDLANVDSGFAVLTQDQVRRVEGGFELLGRLPGAPPRGCSIALEEMLDPLAREGPPR